MQNTPFVSGDRVHRFASDESDIYLAMPPFISVDQCVQAGRAGDFWQRYGALDQITPTMALIIGDFGLGSDSPIILHFADNPQDPSVLRLRWHPDGRTEWVLGANNFDDFAALLGLGES